MLWPPQWSETEPEHGGQVVHALFTFPGRHPVVGFMELCKVMNVATSGLQGLWKNGPVVDKTPSVTARAEKC